MRPALLGVQPEARGTDRRDGNPVSPRQSKSDWPMSPPEFAGTTAHRPRARAQGLDVRCAPNGRSSNRPCVAYSKVEYCHPWLGLRELWSDSPTNLGPSHFPFQRAPRDTLRARIYLAVFYDFQRDYKKAEPLLRQALAIYQKSLGEMHPVCASSLEWLADLYKSQVDYGKA